MKFGDVVDFDGIPSAGLTLEQGTAFPTFNLVIGRKFFRTDQDREYVYTAAGWFVTSSQDYTTTADLATQMSFKVDKITGITVGSGMTGGGNFSASRSIGLSFATAAEAVTGTATDRVINPNVLTTEITRRMTAISVTAGTGLTGGGTLAATRTLAVAYGTTAGTAAQGNDSRLSDARTPVAHTHDDRYYTEAEVDAKFVQATTTVSGISRMATIAETNTGTSELLSVTPAGVKAAISALVDAAPGTLDTLNELAAALGDNPNFATTVGAQIAQKANISHTHPQSEIDGLVAALQAINTSLATAPRTVVATITTAIPAGTWFELPFVQVDQIPIDVYFIQGASPSEFERVQYSWLFNQTTKRVLMRSARAITANAIRAGVTGLGLTAI